MIFTPVLANIGTDLANTAHTIAEQFGVSWWYFVAQCICFTLVALILNKFAYKPVVDMLEVRRAKIAESLKNAEEIKTQLAEAQKSSQDLIAKASADAQRIIEEARAAAKAISDRAGQGAILEAEQIIAKAREATNLDRARMMDELKKELARLVIDTTSRVTGKVLTADDQKRLSEEATRAIAA